MRLPVEVDAVAKLDRRPEIVLHVLYAALDTSLDLGPIRATPPRLEADPEREVQKRGVPVRHAGGVPPQDHDLRIVVEARPRQAAEALEGIQVAADEARDIGAADELDIEQPRPGQDHREAPVQVPLAVRGQEGEVPKVDLRLLPRLGLEAHRRLHRAAQPEWPYVVFQNGVAPGVALRAELTQQDHAVFHTGRQAPADGIPERI